LQGSFFVRVDPPRELGTPVSRRQAVVINGKEPEMVQVVSGRYNGMKGTVIGISGSSLELYFGDINPLKIEVPATDVVALEKMAVAG